jgi:acyl-coenzyme A synthetase/AMP-(fatty) acid ligase
MRVAERIFAQARATPDKTAIIADGRVLSYRDLAAAIAMVRTAFEAHAGDRSRIAILFTSNLAEGWIAGLALRSLGVTTVCARVLGDLRQWPAGGLIAVTGSQDATPDLRAAAQAVGAPLVVLPALGDEAIARAAFDEAPVNFADPPGGHILLTSGTTGLHKKVLIDPAFEADGVALRAAMYGLADRSVVNLFDFGGWTVAGYQTAVCVWSLGGTVVFHQGRGRWRSLQGVTLAYVQPQMLLDLLAAPPEIPLRNDAMTLIVGAGVLPAADWRAARERLTRDIRTGYGSTEAGPCCLTRVESVEDLTWHAVHPAFEVQVVDDHDRPVPVGVTGLVRVKATAVTGYVDDPETTRTFFKDGYFYPGDLGRFREDGRLSIEGRVTDVINVRGDKIATTPIETQLQETLGAEAVCVFSVGGADGEAVHVAIQPREPVTAEALKAALQKALPGVPEVRVHPVTGFPRNAMGKIERAALKAQLLAPKSAQ